MKNSEFYNILSIDYDTMIKFENSLKNKLENLKNFIKPNFKYALDLGCGTGADSIALSQLGLRVDAVDHSADIINKAIQNSQKFKVKINFINFDLSKRSQNKKYDFIVSLGNTLINLPKIEIENLFAKLKFIFSEKGKILIQTVNYSALPNSGEYILNTFENERIKIIRK